MSCWVAELIFFGSRKFRRINAPAARAARTAAFSAVFRFILYRALPVGVTQRELNRDDAIPLGFSSGDSARHYVQPNESRADCTCAFFACQSARRLLCSSKTLGGTLCTKSELFSFDFTVSISAS